MPDQTSRRQPLGMPRLAAALALALAVAGCAGASAGDDPGDGDVGDGLPAGGEEEDGVIDWDLSRC